MKEEYKKYTIIGIVVSLTVLSLLYMIKNKNSDYEFVTMPITEEETIKLTDENKDLLSVEMDLEEDILIIEIVPVYVCGEVENPDVYYLKENAIVKEVIAAAGGFTVEADKNAWNLALEIQKGEKIYVPKVGEQIDKTSNSYDNREGDMKIPDTTSQLININKATSQELSTLPGIGPAISQNIIDYRETNGDFKSLQDVNNVSRIGKTTIEKIKDYICFQ